MPQHVLPLSHFRTAILAASISLLSTVTQAAEIFWASDPVKPGQTVQITGMDLDTIRQASISRLDDAADKTGSKPVQSVSPALQSDKTLTYVIPSTLANGVYALTLLDASGTSITTRINSADIYWTQGDAGESATPGGWLRVQGRNIARTASARLELTAENGRITTINPDAPDIWSARFAIPADMRTGTYQARLWNGNGDASTWQDLGSITVTAKPVPAQRKMELRSNPVDGPALDDTARINAALAGLANQGGGTLVLRSGIYHLSGGITIPEGVTLKGQSRELVNLIWNDMDQPPPALIEGYRNFAVEDLTIDAQRHFDVIKGGFDAQGKSWTGGNFILRNLLVRASAFMGHLKADDAASRDKALTQQERNGVAGLRLGGSNILVEGCDIISSNRSFVLNEARNARLEGNTFTNGRNGWYHIGGSQRILFENNRIVGGDMQSTGGGIGNLGGYPLSKGVLMRNNSFARFLSVDREAMTSDGPGGYYFGTLKILSPTTFQMIGELGGMKDRSWLNAGLFVLGGRGTGLVVNVVSRQDNIVTVDRPIGEKIDPASTVTITPMQEEYLIINNDFTDVGAAQIYGTGYRHVFAGNTMTRGAGIQISGRRYQHPQPNFFIQLLDNTIREPDLTGKTELAVYAQQFDGNTSILSLGNVVRGNTLSQNVMLRVAGNATTIPLLQGILVEDNDISQTDIGIMIGAGVKDLTLRNNNIAQVRVPVKGMPQP
ncbi:hypothetical protein FNA46_07100 [Rhizobium straminoryzae]|uniref:Uncharacterized protein n=2 Tax=Rhizobium straminoryzae TaxID=1387186 RepID=A0A549TD94_9HYPH|nr:hypothetical protein FNA46_07100 [Rhizobium straminoryzae]